MAYDKAKWGDILEILTICGAKPLFGTVTIPTAKNSLLPIAAAALMLDGECVIKNCPNLSDLKVSTDIINSIGSKAVLSEKNLFISYSESEKTEIDNQLCKKMRSGILYISPLLHRKGKVTLYRPGGCNLGERKIDIHLEGLKKMGAQVSFDEDEKITITAQNGLKGTQFRLNVPSVGATQTLIMAAVQAKGITILRNCAREPEVVDLAHFLKCAGAKITGAGKSEIIIQGVQNLNAVEYTPIPDRIFAATVLSAINACKGICFMKNYPQEFMGKFEELLKKTGLKLMHMSSGTLAVKCFDKAADIKAYTGYYPLLSTDMGPLLSSALVNNNGTLCLTEGVFENRFSYKSEFEKLGLCCRTEGRKYFQSAKNEVYNANLKASDLRAGAAIVVAALAKRGRFTVEGLEYIDRGYEKIEEVFSSIGGNIRRNSVEQ